MSLTILLRKKGTKSYLYEISCCTDFSMKSFWKRLWKDFEVRHQIDKKYIFIFFSKKTKTKIQKLILTIAMTMKKMVMVMSIKMAWTNPKMDSGNYLFFRFNSTFLSFFRESIAFLSISFFYNLFLKWMIWRKNVYFP